MKTLIATATIAVITSNISFGQCNKSGGHISRPVYRPQPVVVHKPYRPVTKPSCSIKPAPIVHKPAPIIPPAPLPQIAAGQRVTIDGRLFGHSPGSVVVRIGQMILQAQLAGWSSSQAVAILPELPISGPTPATVVVNTAYGKKAAELDVELLPAAAPVGGIAQPQQQPQPTVVAPGQAVTLDGANLGTVRGQIQLNISGITLIAQVSTWTNASVTATLPNMQLAQPVEAKLNIVKADGTVADSLDVVFSPGGETVASR